MCPKWFICIIFNEIIKMKCGVGIILYLMVHVHASYVSFLQLDSPDIVATNIYNEGDDVSFEGFQSVYNNSTILNETTSEKSDDLQKSASIKQEGCIQNKNESGLKDMVVSTVEKEQPQDDGGTKQDKPKSKKLLQLEKEKQEKERLLGFMKDKNEIVTEGQSKNGLNNLQGNTLSTGHPDNQSVQSFEKSNTSSETESTKIIEEKINTHSFPAQITNDSKTVIDSQSQTNTLDNISTMQTAPFVNDSLNTTPIQPADNLTYNNNNNIIQSNQNPINSDLIQVDNHLLLQPQQTQSPPPHFFPQSQAQQTQLLSMSQSQPLPQFYPQPIQDYRQNQLANPLSEEARLFNNNPFPFRNMMRFQQYPNEEMPSNYSQKEKINKSQLKNYFKPDSLDLTKIKYLNSLITNVIYPNLDPY
jgi:hypothetical protein